MNNLKLKLTRQIDESAVVHTLVEVHKIRKITQQQMEDIFSTSPNHIPQIVERANEFLEKMSYLVTMHKREDACQDPGYAKTHPDQVKAVQAYFAKDEMYSDKCSDDIIALGCKFVAIGKFCISTEKFIKETSGYPGETMEEKRRNFIDTIKDEMDEYEKDRPAIDRYARIFFKKLLDKHADILPENVYPSDIMSYIKKFIYNEDGYNDE